MNILFNHRNIYCCISSDVEIAQLTELAREVLNQRTLFQVDLESADKAILDMLKVGTSARGAKPKAIIAWNEATKEVRSGQVKAPDGFTYWLLKFDGVEDKKLNDHTKNHSFLMDQNGVWRLAPAYDLCYSYSPSGKWTSRHQLSLNNKRDEFTYNDLLIVAKNMSIKNANVIIQKL